MRIQRISENSTKNVISDSINLDLMNPIIEKYKNKKGNLIPLLQGTQDLYGYIPKEAFTKLSRETDLKLNDMYGVATFYAQFRLTPVGKFIVKICHGTACHVQNVTAVTNALLDFLEVKDGETTSDKLFTIETVACLGCCSLAPVMMIASDTYGKLNSKEAVKVIKEIRRKESLTAKN